MYIFNAHFYLCADMETDVIMIPVVNRVWTKTIERTSSPVAASNRVFDFRWNDLIKKTMQIPHPTKRDLQRVS